MHVYRNGILIGPLYREHRLEGPVHAPGVFTILEKKAGHYSKIQQRPMPNMQRLTWTGIAMHSVSCPAILPATAVSGFHSISRNCFSSRPRKAAPSSSVMGKTPPTALAANPGLMLAPKDFNPEMLRSLAANDYDWHPERSESGRSQLSSALRDRALYVYRNGNPIGRGALEIAGPGRLGSHVCNLLEGKHRKAEPTRAGT